MPDTKLIISVDNVVEKILMNNRFAVTEELQRLFVEAGILRMTKAERGVWAKLAEETFASLTSEVIDKMAVATGVVIIKRERITIRTMQSSVSISDKAGMMSTLSRGFGSYTCTCIHRDADAASMTWFN